MLADLEWFVSGNLNGRGGPRVDQGTAFGGPASRRALAAAAAAAAAATTASAAAGGEGGEGGGTGASNSHPASPLRRGIAAEASYAPSESTMPSAMPSHSDYYHAFGTVGGNLPSSPFHHPTSLGLWDMGEGEGIGKYGFEVENSPWGTLSSPMRQQSPDRMKGGAGARQRRGAGATAPPFLDPLSPIVGGAGGKGGGGEEGGVNSVNLAQFIGERQSDRRRVHLLAEWLDASIAGACRAHAGKCEEACEEGIFILASQRDRWRDRMALRKSVFWPLLLGGTYKAAFSVPCLIHYGSN